jgi:hypothetical protein
MCGLAREDSSVYNVEAMWEERAKQPRQGREPGSEVLCRREEGADGEEEGEEDEQM